MKILLAEDDFNISTIAQIALEAIGGHDVTLARDGEEALSYAQSQDFDLILLDEMMPKLNGLNVCKKLIELQYPAPIIFLSAKSQANDVELFESLGSGFIPKPFDPSTLNSEIDRILQRNNKTEKSENNEQD